MVLNLFTQDVPNTSIAGSFKGRRRADFEKCNCPRSHHQPTNIYQQHPSQYNQPPHASDHVICVDRPTSGLRPQHLTGLQLIADVSNGSLINGEVGSTCINFKLGRLTEQFSAIV